MTFPFQPSVEPVLSGEDWRLLIESIQDYAIFMLDPRGYVVSWNRGAEAIKGYRASEIIGRHFSTFYPEETRVEAVEQLELVRREGRIEREGWRLRKDGSRFWADVVITALFDAQGELRGFGKVTRDLTLRRGAEEELRRSEERLRLLIEAVSDYAIYMLDPEGKVTTWNPGAQRLKGYTAAEIIGQSYARFFREADVLAHKPERELTIARTEGRFAEEGVRVRKDQSQFWASVVLTPIVDAAGTLMGYAKVTRDLTARMKADETTRELGREQTSRALAEASEARLRESEERYRALSRRLEVVLEAVADGIAVQDLSAQVVFANTAAARTTGFASPDAFLRAGPAELAATFELRDAHGEPFDVAELPGLRALRGEGANSALLRVRDLRTRREAWWQLLATPVLGPLGEPELAVNIVRDVTAERRREQYDRWVAQVTVALAESLDYAALSLKLAHLLVPGLADLCALYLLEPGAPVLSAVAHSDAQKGAGVGALSARFAPDPQQAHGVWSVLQGGPSQLFTDIGEPELVALAGDPERLAVLRELGVRSAMIVPLSVRGTVLGCMLLAYAESRRRYDRHDVSLAEELGRRAGIAIENALLYAAERAARDQVEQAAQRAERANRLKDEFLATLSHELRTPLNAILGWASVLRGSELSADVAKGVEVIHRNAYAQARIIDDLLDIARITAGKLRLELRPSDLVSIVRDAIEVVRPSALAKDMTLSFEAPLESCVLMADPERLQQVLWNLLSNAVKFSQPGASIRVELARLGTQLKLSVRDTGQGIEPEFLPFVFERFRQADSSATRRVGGLGLGLSIVRYLVELHGGEVSAHSEGRHKGAVFSVLLPQRAPAPAVIRALASDVASELEVDRSHSARFLPGRRVLVVDDEPDARDLLSTVLRDAGAVVETAASAAEALAALARFRPHVLVSDIGMPGEDGYAFIRRVNALDAASGGGIPSLALTAYARSEDKATALAMGFTTYLPKPVKPDELLAAVANLAAFVHR